MTKTPTHSRGITYRRRLLIFALIFPLTLTTDSHVDAQQAKSASVGECVSNQGVVLVQAKNDWRSVQPNQPLPANQSLVTMFDSSAISANKAVSFRMIGGIGAHGSFSVFSTSVQVHPNAKRDLDITLERGIVVFTNKKTKGAATIRLRARNKSLDLSLQEPGTQVGLEVYSRHGPGAAAIAKDEPVTFAYFLTLKGHAVLSNPKKSIRLQAPPGPAVLKWDSLFQQPEVEYLHKLPADLQPSKEEKETFAAMNQCVKGLDKQLVDGLKSLVNSKSAVCRKVGVTAMGATNQLPLLFHALAKSKHADVRAQAILVLREWLGRSPGQIKKLKADLTGECKLPSGAANTVIHMLIGFDDEERSQPALYDMLIGMLKHQRLAARELAHWHLVRLVAKGKEITYDAAGSAQQHDEAVRQWRQLIPVGQLPPDPETSSKPVKK